jgi:hypothetical protein
MKSRMFLAVAPEARAAMPRACSSDRKPIGSAVITWPRAAAKQDLLGLLTNGTAKRS